ncbi:MAG: methylmalonyl-CoA carboxyltransferase [Myxococcaceae bacterium]|nr:methylmalonyl-CoA carboxyltransferase [Myxococcaceae bacterium]
MSDLGPLLDELRERNARADQGGGADKVARQHRLGRWTARERIAALVDAGSFEELGRHVLSRHGDASPRLQAAVLPGDGLVCGLGAVNGRTIAVYAHEPTVLRGSFGHEASKKLCRLLDLALERRFPVVALMDSEGVRVEEGTHAVESFGEVIGRTITLKGKVPQLTLACGLCVGGAAYTAVLTDCVGMVDGQSFMFVTGDAVTRTVTGSGATIDELGGQDVHAKLTGACHAVLADEAAGIAWLKALLAALEPRVASSDRVDREVPELETLVPVSPRKPYDMRKVLAAVFDADSVLELSASYGPNLLTAFARLGGRSVAVVASQPKEHAGCLDVHASRKGAAFVRWAGALGLPVVTLVDVPGYLPGKEQEALGILPHGATLLSAYGTAHVPKVCLVMRKSYGGASVLSFAADLRLGLPMARVDVMGPEGALQVVLGAEPEGATPQQLAERAEAKARWLERRDSAWAAAETGYLDRIIEPRAVRRELSLALERLAP